MKVNIKLSDNSLRLKKNLNSKQIQGILIMKVDSFSLSLLICQTGIQGVPFIQNKFIGKWIFISKELNKHKVPGCGSYECYVPLAQPPGVQRRWQLVFRGLGRAEPGIFLSQGPTKLHGQKLNVQLLVPKERVRIERTAVREKEGLAQPGRDGSPARASNSMLGYS